jgi:hypothetical protein
VTSLTRNDASLQMTFAAHRYVGAEVIWFDGHVSHWIFEGNWTATLSTAAAPAGFPAPDSYYAGLVRDAEGEVIGELTAGWVAAHWRSAIVEIDCVPAAPFPRDNGAGATWLTIFADAGWDVRVVESDRNVPEPP